MVCVAYCCSSVTQEHCRVFLGLCESELYRIITRIELYMDPRHILIKTGRELHHGGIEDSALDL
jgi:hypothetical protein